MNLVVGAVVLVLVTCLTVAAMLGVRRRAPEGSYFTDGDRASGVFGVLATGFSVLLGFIIFLAFSVLRRVPPGRRDRGDDRGPAGADRPVPARDSSAELTGELTCYARSVAGTGVGRAERGTLGDAINPWGPSCSVTISTSIPRRRPSSRRTTGGWTRRPTASRPGSTGSTARRASSPLPLWLVLFVISGVIFAYMLFFADRAEGAVTQGMLMGSVTVVITPAAVPAGVLRPPARRRGRSAPADRDGADPAPDRHPARGRRDLDVDSSV